MLKNLLLILSFAVFTLFGEVTLIKIDTAKKISQALRKDWERRQITPADPVDDAIFLRRVYLDVTGNIPSPAQVRNFLRDKDRDKRENLINHLLDSPEYADLMAMRFADMFRIKSEFPINLWPNAVQLYHRYFREAIRQNRPWDEISRELLTGSGSNFRSPQANFFRATADRSPKGLAAAAALSFMGIRFEKLSSSQQKEFANFFSRICYKSTDEWKEEIVFLNPIPAIVKATTPDGCKFTINSPEKDPREVFANWLTAEDNPFFAKAFVNRLWYWIFGYGLINPSDDMPLPPVGWGKISAWFRGSKPKIINPELLEVLTDEFKRSGYDIKNLLRLILNSPAYNRDSRIDKDILPEATACFAVYPIRRLGAEVIIDILGKITRDHERYRSVIPEPFTIIPPNFPAVKLADGSISSGLLDNFGRPPRDTGLLSERKNIITPSQRQYLMNSGTLYRQLSRVPGQIFRGRKLSTRQQIEELYLLVLSRPVTSKEWQEIKFYHKQMPKRQRGRITHDLLWVLVNTKEFLYHH